MKIAYDLACAVPSTAGWASRSVEGQAHSEFVLASLDPSNGPGSVSSPIARSGAIGPSLSPHQSSIMVRAESGGKRMGGQSDSEVLALLDAMLNMTAFHREHEKFYSSSPREQAVVLQRHSRSLHALADRWSVGHPSTRTVLSPYEGADDLNADAALQLDGILFMEGEGEPSEITRLKRELRTMADDSSAAGDWLDTAMLSSWSVVPALFDIAELADLLGERHRIIANNLQGASTVSLVGRILSRAADLLEQVDFAPAALRARLADHHVAAGHVYSAAEMIDHAADLLSDFASLVHDNERRWRVFRARVEHTADLRRAT